MFLFWVSENLSKGVSTQHVEKAASSMHSVFRRRVPDSGGRKDTCKREREREGCVNRYGIFFGNDNVLKNVY